MVDIRETRESLSSTYVALEPLAWSGWAEEADGSPVSLDSGQAITHTNGWAGDTGANLTVVSGRLTNTTTAAAVRAGYITVAAQDTVRRIGAAWTWDGAAPAGTAVLADWVTDLPSTIAAVPDAACHLACSPSAVTAGIFDGGALSIKDSWTWPSAPVSGTEYRLDVTIDPEAQTVTITLPWGEVVSYSDARVATHAGNFPSWEVYLPDASAASRPGFVDVWADTRRDHAWHPAATPASVAESLTKQRTLVASDITAAMPKAMQSTTAATVTITASLADVDPTNYHLAHTVPASGGLLIEASLYLEVTTPGRMIWQVANGVGGTVYGTRFMTDKAGEGYYHYRGVVTGLTPGATFDAVMRTQIIDSGAATITIGGNNPATLSITPLAP